MLCDIGLDMARANADANGRPSTSFRQHIADMQASVADRTLSIFVFVNSTPLREFGEAQLKALVERELKGEQARVKVKRNVAHGALVASGWAMSRGVRRSRVILTLRLANSTLYLIMGALTTTGSAQFALWIRKWSTGSQGRVRDDHVRMFVVTVLTPSTPRTTFATRWGSSV